MKEVVRFYELHLINRDTAKYTATNETPVLSSMQAKLTMQSKNIEKYIEKIQSIINQVYSFTLNSEVGNCASHFNKLYKY